MDFLLAIAQRLWIDSRGSRVRWEGRDGRVREVYMSNTCLLTRRARAAGWQGSNQLFVNYLWAPGLETGQTQGIVS